MNTYISPLLTSKSSFYASISTIQLTRTTRLVTLLTTILVLITGCKATTGVKDEASIQTDSKRATAQSKSPSHATPRPLTASDDLWQRIRQGYALDHGEVSAIGQQRIDELLTRYRRHPQGITKQTEQAKLYLYYVVSELEKRNMPLELALLPFVESSYNPFAYSSSRAAGLWQFIPNTGKRFKLHENWWLDKRRDVVASTQAAIRYLNYLHQYFSGDWLLAIAAYNAGEGTVSRAVKKNKKALKATDYWSLDLPKETLFYIPKLLAWKSIVEWPEEYQFRLAKISNTPQFTTIDVGSQIDLAKVAHMSDISIEHLYALNPAYNRWATDPDAPHELLLPIDKAETVKASLSQYPISERVQWHRYIIKPNDSLGKIAQQHNTTVTVIQRANQLKGTTIRVGKTLLIPMASEQPVYYSKSAEQRVAVSTKKSSQKKTQHTVQKGETLWSIAKRYKLSTQKIAQWNKISPQDILRLKQTLVIWH